MDFFSKTYILDKLSSFKKNEKDVNTSIEKKKNNKFKTYGDVIKHDIKSITEKFVFESQGLFQQNSFRLDLRSIAIDNIHAKFQLTRFGEIITVELLYPNVKNEITIKITTENSLSKIFTINIEDDQFKNYFSQTILKEIDNLIQEAKSKSNIKINPYYNQSNGSLPALGSVSPVWEAKWLNAISLVEDVFDNIKNQFTEKDFSLSDPEIDFKNLEDFSAGDVNSDETATDFGKKDEFRMKFREKTDWSHAAIDSMQKLISDAIAKQMQFGNGIVLTSDEILKGTIGIENDSVYQTIDKFLKIYPELDGVDIQISWLNQIEDKLSKKDGQFDAFLQQNIDKIIGKDVVDDALNNEMFDTFIPMGAKKEEDKPYVKPTFDEFVNNFKENENNIEKNEEQNEEDEELKTPLTFNKDEILKKVYSNITLDELPNITKKSN